MALNRKPKILFCASTLDIFCTSIFPISKRFVPLGTKSGSLQVAVRKFPLRIL